MDAQTAARLLGGKAKGNRVYCPGPDHSSKDRSLSVLFTPTGFIVTPFSARDNWQDCKDYIKTKLGISDNWKPDPTKFKPAEKGDEQNYEWSMEIWDKSRPVGDTLAAKYLASRSIPIDLPCIRYHPRLAMERGSYHPSLVAIYRDIKTNEPRGIQRTFLTSDGHKIDRWMLGPSKGAAIKIDEDEDISNSIAIGEGLETCLSAKRLGMPPVWALMSSGGVEAMPVLDGIDSITFLAERDNARQNEMATKRAARNWLLKGREVSIYFPRDGKDMNDAIRTNGNA